MIRRLGVGGDVVGRRVKRPNGRRGRPRARLRGVPEHRSRPLDEVGRKAPPQPRACPRSTPDGCAEERSLDSIPQLVEFRIPHRA